MVETATFNIRRKEDLIASMIGYLSGHTSLVTDFSEGSIIRSIMEAVSQEMYRQNVVYAQSLVGAIRTSIKQAFSLPLLEATKATGNITFYRKMLAAPANAAVSFSTDSSLSDSYSASSSITMGAITPSGSFNFTGYIGSSTDAGSSITEGSAILTVTSNSAGTLAIGQYITGTGVTAGTKITSIISGTTVFGLNISQSRTAISLTASSAWTYTLTFPVSSGNFTANSSLVSSAALGSGTLTFSGYTIASSLYSMTVIASGGNIPAGSPASVAWTNPRYKLTAPASFTVTPGASGGSFSAGMYYWSVSAINGTIESACSEVVSAAIAASGIATLEWSSVTGATNYRIYISTSPYMTNAKYQQVSTVSYSQTAFNGTATNWPGTDFTWSISATNVSNNVNAETVPSVIRYTPTGNSAAITWSPVSSGDGSAITGYKVYRSKYDAFLGVPSNVVATKIYNASQTFVAAEQYYWAISTLTKTGESQSSSPVSLTFAADTLLSASLSWTLVRGAIGYRVYRSSSANMSSAVSIDVSTNSFIDYKANVTTSAIIPTAYLLGTVTSPTLVNNIATWRFVDTGDSGSASSVVSSTTAQSISGPISIGAGTLLSVGGTSKQYSVLFQSTMSSAQNSLDVLVQSSIAGKVGNSPAKTINTLITTLSGINNATNLIAFSNGTDLETEEEWRIRFSKLIKDIARGTLASIEAGALTSQISDSNGYVMEKVTKSLAYEASSNVVALYVHNGETSGSSVDLTTLTQKIINGYVDDLGVRKAGYKPAGIPVTVYKAELISQNLELTVTTESGVTLLMVQASIYETIENYFNSLDISDGFKIPTISSLTASSAGSASYQYRIVAVDTSGNKSLPSISVTRTNAPSSLTKNGSGVPVNYIDVTWTVEGANIYSYDILRWTGTDWGQVGNYVGNSGTLTFRDGVTTPSPYTFTIPNVKIFQKSSLIQLIMRIPGVSAVTINVPDSVNADQESIVPAVGKLLVPGTISIR